MIGRPADWNDSMKLCYAPACFFLGRQGGSSGNDPPSYAKAVRSLQVAALVARCWLWMYGVRTPYVCLYISSHALFSHQLDDYGRVSVSSVK